MTLRLQYHPYNLRLVVYKNFIDGKVYRFLTDDFSIDAIIVAGLYRERWQIETMFNQASFTLFPARQDFAYS